jgi:hypothetical protein
MENLNSKKKDSKQNNNCDDFIHSLRSSGMLLPISDEEVKSFKALYGELNEELPDKFKNVDFLFEDYKKKDTVVIQVNSQNQAEELNLAYAARDGQEKIPAHILAKMKELKNKGRNKKTRSSNQ